MGVSRGLLEQGGHGGFFWEVAANYRTVLEETYLKGGIWRLNASGNPRLISQLQAPRCLADGPLSYRWTDGMCTVVPALRPECSQRRPGVETSPSPAHCSQLTGSC